MGNQELKNSREQNEKGGVRTLRNQGNGCVNEERTPSPKLTSFDLLVWEILSPVFTGGVCPRHWRVIRESCVFPRRFGWARVCCGARSRHWHWQQAQSTLEVEVGPSRGACCPCQHSVRGFIFVCAYFSLLYCHLRKLLKLACGVLHSKCLPVLQHQTACKDYPLMHSEKYTSSMIKWTLCRRYKGLG